MFGLVVDRVQSRDVLKEPEKLGMRRRIVGSLKKRGENVVEELVEVFQHVFGFVDIAKMEKFACLM